MRNMEEPRGCHIPLADFEHLEMMGTSPPTQAVRVSFAISRGCSEHFDHSPHPMVLLGRSGSKLSGALHVIQYHSKTNKALVDLFDVTNIPRSPNREQFLTLLGFAR